MSVIWGDNMLYGEYKKTDEYLYADDITVCINGIDEINEMYYPDELDYLDVVGVGYSANGLFIDLACSNWDKRFEVGWVGENIIMT